MFPKAYFPKQYATGRYFPPVDGVIPPTTAGYGLGGPTLIDVFPIVGLAGVPDPVIQTTRQTH